MGGILYRLYRLACPRCPTYIYQPETNLAKIVQRQKASTTGAPFLTLVCPQCKSAYQFDWLNRHISEGAEQTDEPPQTTGLVLFSYVTGCIDSNCESRVELIALHDPGTTEERCYAEMPQWKLDGICCERGHQIVLPRQICKTRQF